MTKEEKAVWYEINRMVRDYEYLTAEEKQSACGMLKSLVAKLEAFAAVAEIAA